LHHGPFDRGHRHPKAASGFSHGLTVGHRSHQTLFQVNRIRTPTPVLCTSRACLCLPQVAVMSPPQRARCLFPWCSACPGLVEGAAHNFLVRRWRRQRRVDLVDLHLL
jgi:hypothetical protein